jgi:hypothetical protein
MPFMMFTMHIGPTIELPFLSLWSNLCPISIGGNRFSEIYFVQKVFAVNALQFDDEMPGNHVYGLLVISQCNH